MADLVVADAGPLIVLARIGHLDVLVAVAGRVIVPTVVIDECIRDRSRPGAALLAKAFDVGTLSRELPEWVVEPLCAPGLDTGEAAAIALARALSAPLLIDERIGRQVARAHSVRVIGTLGILLQAKQRGLVDAIGPLLERAEQAGYFVSRPLRAEALRRAGEDAG